MSTKSVLKFTLVFVVLGMILAILDLTDIITPGRDSIGGVVNDASDYAIVSFFGFSGIFISLVSVSTLLKVSFENYKQENNIWWKQIMVVPILMIIGWVFSFAFILLAFLILPVLIIINTIYLIMYLVKASKLYHKVKNINFAKFIIVYLVAMIVVFCCFLYFIFNFSM